MIIPDAHGSNHFKLERILRLLSSINQIFIDLIANDDYEPIRATAENIGILD